MHADTAHRLVRGIPPMRIAVIVSCLISIFVPNLKADHAEPVLVREARVVPPPEYVVLCDGRVLRGPEDCERLGLQPQDYFGEVVVDEWAYLEYDRFDLYVEEAYYASNTPAIDEFFDLFESRFALLEATTGWTSETNFGARMRIEVTGTEACYGGAFNSSTLVTYLVFSDPLYRDNPEPESCAEPYYVDGAAYFGNPGELGDFWRYMALALHEATHAIGAVQRTPYHISRWLSEGWATYYEYNILPTFGDINQETANTYICCGVRKWADYVANDYMVSYPILDDVDIQHSGGYRLTAWMFSMLTDPSLSPEWSSYLHPLNWSAFYDLLDHNLETLEKGYELGGHLIDSYHSDIIIIDLFSKAMGVDLYPVFRYDGPDGPGWGVRYWIDTDWYADIVPVLGFSRLFGIPGESIDIEATVFNNGDTDANDFPVTIYAGATLLDVRTISVAASSSAALTVPFIVPEDPCIITVRVDEDDIKLETDESNNEATGVVTFGPCVDSDNDGYGDPGHPENACPVDNCPADYNPDQANSDGDDLGDVCDTCCVGRVGDANGSGEDEPTISDVAVMIDAKFISGICDGVVECLSEADINQSGGADPTCDDITIGDISALIDYLFITGPENATLAECL